MRLVLIGARADGQAHLVLDTLTDGVAHEVVAFLDETPELWNTNVHGIPVLGPPAAIDTVSALGVRGGMISIGSGRARERLAEFLEKAGLDQPSIVHPRAYVAPSARLGRGIFVGVHAVISTGATIGDLALVPPTAFVSHHVAVGTAASLSPGVKLAGRSRIGCRAFVGLGAIVLPDKRVGDDAVVGAGSVVIDDVPPGATVAGVPARVVKS